MAETDAPCFNLFQGGSFANNVAIGKNYINAVSYRSEDNLVTVGNCKSIVSSQLCGKSDSYLSDLVCLSTPGGINGADRGEFSDDVFGDFDDDTERVFSISRQGIVAIGYPDYHYIISSQSPSNSPTTSVAPTASPPTVTPSASPSTEAPTAFSTRSLPPKTSPPKGPKSNKTTGLPTPSPTRSPTNSPTPARVIGVPIPVFPLSTSTSDFHGTFNRNSGSPFLETDYIGHVSIFYPSDWGTYDPYFFANPDLMTATGFGSSVCLSDDGNFLAIGAPLSRKVYVYRKESNEDWRDFETLSYPTTGANFGKKIGVSSDGKFIVVAADDFAKVYYLPTSSSNYDDSIEPIEYSNFGFNVDFEKGVAMDGDLLIVYGKNNSGDITTVKVRTSYEV